MKAKYVVGGTIIIAFMLLASMSFKGNLVKYVSIAEAKNTSRIVQIKGARVLGSEGYDAENKTFNFKICDDKGEELLVKYNGVKPSNFEMAKEVVAKGKYYGGVFHAEDLLIKCPSKYEAEIEMGEAS